MTKLQDREKLLELDRLIQREIYTHNNFGLAKAFLDWHNSKQLTEGEIARKLQTLKIQLHNLDNAEFIDNCPNCLQGIYKTKTREEVEETERLKNMHIKDLAHSIKEAMDK